jgi:hypothetical protein
MFNSLLQHHRCGRRVIDADASFLSVSARSRRPIVAARRHTAPKGLDGCDDLGYRLWINLTAPQNLVREQRFEPTISGFRRP